jgi:RpiB/LacA/LacB family sugar-phosphate isomerase
MADAPEILIGSDHAGYALKEFLKTHLSARGHLVIDKGCPSADRAVDYPDVAALVGRGVVQGEAPRGILVCGTGIGMSIAANKVPGIRAALVHDPFTAALAGRHNLANVLCLGGRLVAPEYAVELVEAWLHAAFEERHRPRLDKIQELERKDPEAGR